ncbi:MAG: hypothetical protein F6K24_24875 [Okeania sp. SIO2D1]|nr:hypothetical protein [Okeania sp. SIO2D1]
MIEKSQSGKNALPDRQINKIVELYVEQIIEKLQTEKLISNIKGSENHINLLIKGQNILEFTKYLSQAFYHHVDACIEYMGTTEFIERMKVIIEAS